MAMKHDDDPLRTLRVFRSLEVGPVELKPNRLMAPYTLTADGGTETTVLTYRFEEAVFDPDALIPRNLASMISAQVALNYGLFCDEMVFHGTFDAFDRRFLHDMAENTAREIYVKKFLEPNPFLLEGVRELPAVKRESYLRAQLRFTGEDRLTESLAGAVPAESSDRDGTHGRCAVLSSGGKDSLLSFGLLKEIGGEVHPIFVNESGRHWFTALNAYRYFAQNVPDTSRVWTNSDRVFSWMLRHLPFVRPDFADLRSDEYPIRLWTVAVFLFGALPLLRKRGITRLIIGDEYDTTRRSSFKGITHYDGLYDQSRYFDNTLSRYFHRKGWQVSQFSILRPCSEPLIQKLLVERYPELQRLQMSCHAAHKGSDRILPCGRCEKCRRIVGMLMAFGADPHGCGYTEEQTRNCLRVLPEHGILQEKDGIRHLGYLLKERGLLDGERIGAMRVEPRREVMKLRFDAERSPAEAIPMELRQPLYRICLRHAEGSVKRVGRAWIDFDMLTDPVLQRPYPFEAARALSPSTSEGSRPSDARSAYLLGELTWPEAQKRLRRVDVALLPVGSIEQHGPHLPLDTDAFDADYLARRVAEACQASKPIVLPLIPYGVAYHHQDFKGTMSISPESLSQLVHDIGMSAARNGITKLVVINGHGGNAPALHFAAQMINRDAHIFTCVDTGETSAPDIDALAETRNDVHAGEIETSTALATRPGLVRLDKLKSFVPEFSNRYLNFSSKRSIGWYAQIAKISPDGVLGDPTKATEEKGRRMWDTMVKHLVEFVEALMKMSLDEIYQRRY
jgi:creatinine amidohydrolase/Fe(II)-dependent formamide hydrolase-like protein